MEPKLDDLAKDAVDQIGGPFFRVFGALRRRLAQEPAPDMSGDMSPEEVREAGAAQWEDLGQAIESDKRGLRERLLAAIRRRK